MGRLQMSRTTRKKKYGAKAIDGMCDKNCPVCQMAYKFKNKKRIKEIEHENMD